jgi:hypothetical protein
MSFIPDIPTMYPLNNNHPIQPNPQEVIYYKKYVSIHSEDRDIIKFPNSSEFDIELPEDLLNVSSIRLSTWTFPANYSTFSELNGNIKMSFQITAPYNPAEHSFSDPLQNAIFKCLAETQYDKYEITIEEGFYNPEQMVTELTNKFNEAVTVFLRQCLDPSLLASFESAGGYSNFVIVYNSVNQKIWFGNTADGFRLLNEDQSSLIKTSCETRSRLPEYSNWGLPNNIGLGRNNTDSVTIPGFTPRFYYGDVHFGDKGYWLLPNPALNLADCYYIECPYKINLMGPSHFYMELHGQNCIDETSPYSVSGLTLHTNETNGRVNSAFAKIAVPTTPIAQWFDRDSVPYKLYVPPAERMRKLRFRLRYHNGQLVNFGLFDYSFTLEFVMLQPQQIRSVKSFGKNF